MLEIEALPAFRDNYIWSIKRPDADQVYVVDPGDGQVVRQYLTNRGLKLAGILVTHHHPDHTAGIPTLCDEHRVSVYGPANETIPRRTHALKDADTIHLDALNLTLAVIAIPGHTLGHIAYYAAAADALFAGDTLFSVGCGRLFEGTAENLLASLKCLRSLPEQTNLYCGHEYTLANIQFALHVDPDNTWLHRRREDAEQARTCGIPTLPSSLGTEKLTNPFLRWDQPSIIQAMERRTGQALKDDVSVLAALRHWKNNFKL